MFKRHFRQVDDIACSGSADCVVAVGVGVEEGIVTCAALHEVVAAIAAPQARIARAGKNRVVDSAAASQFSFDTGIRRVNGSNIADEVFAKTVIGFAVEPNFRLSPDISRNADCRILFGRYEVIRRAVVDQICCIDLRHDTYAELHILPDRALN